MRVLVTGGAGFIGSNIVENLLGCGHYVRVIDNLSTGSEVNIKSFVDNPNFEFINGDITDKQVFEASCEGIDTICHQAALGSVPRSIDHPDQSHSSNVNGFVNVLMTAKKLGIRRIVYASSSAVYGSDCTPAKTENCTGELLSPYAITKFIDELYARIFTRLYGLECIGLRYFNVYGPRQNPAGEYAAVIPKFINQFRHHQISTINGNGSYSRDFIYVSDVVNANMLALTTSNTDCFGQVYNIGTGSSFSILELYNQIKTITESSLEPVFGPAITGDIDHSMASIENARKHLGFAPEISFEVGLRYTIKYFESIEQPNM